MTVPSFAATLPSYYDDEVTHFHPLMEWALDAALERLQLETDYEVKHHYRVGRLVADFAVVTRNTGRVVLFIEVKRRPGDVVSTRYRVQAQGYVSQSRGLVEKPYYALTNLEVTAAFKYSPSRPQVEQQLLNLGLLEAGRFASTDPTLFMEELVLVAEKLLKTSTTDQGEYHVLSGHLVDLLKARAGDPTRWHELMTVVGYEYVRGSMGRSHLPDAYHLRSRSARLLTHGQGIDFAPLFTTPVAPPGDKEVWDVQLLRDVFLDGQRSITGAELPELMHAITSSGKETDGRVSTDPELARLTSVLAAYVHGDSLASGEVVADPAAGSGALLQDVVEGFPDIQPNQLWANEVVETDLEHLSLRLGLAFKGAITPTKSPTVTINDVTDLGPDTFENVGVVLLNPPFVAGIRSSLEKERFSTKYQAAFGVAPKTALGQAGLEAIFLEYVLALVKPGTTLAVIFPSQYLNAPGREAEQMRKFLLEDFGLQFVALYPRKGLFEQVQKDTAVFVGKKGAQAENIEVLEITIPLESVDLGNVKSSLRSASSGYGFQLSTSEWIELHETSDSGWKLSSIGRRTDEWVREALSPKTQKLDSAFALKRGELGGSGGTDLIFPESLGPVWQSVEQQVPQSWLKPGLRKVDEIESGQPIVTNAHYKRVTLVAPDAAFTAGTTDYDILSDILNVYHPLQRPSKSQSRSVKTVDELRTILRRSRRETSPGAVLVPRNLRRWGRAYLLAEPAYLSTNVIKVEPRTLEEGKLLLSWLLTVFAQLHQESIAKIQEGPRKLEVNGGVGSILVPSIDNLSAGARTALLLAVDSASPLDLREPIASEIDQIWATELWGESADKRLYQALELLEEIVFNRNPADD